MKPRVEISLHGERVQELVDRIRKKYDVTVFVEDPEDQYVSIESTEIWKQAGPMVAHGQTLAWGQYVVGITLALVVLIPVWNISPLAGAVTDVRSRPCNERSVRCRTDHVDSDVYCRKKRMLCAWRRPWTSATEREDRETGDTDRVLCQP